MQHRTTRALKVAASLGVVTLVAGVVVALSHWRQTLADPVGVAAAGLGLALVVFVTYLAFGVAGYDVSADGTASVPRRVAWPVAALAAIFLLVAIFALALLRSSSRVIETTPRSLSALAAATPQHRNSATETAPASCPDEPTRPEPLPQSGTSEPLITEFTKLFETGQFVLGYCVAEARLNEVGAVESVRLVRPPHLDDRIRNAIVRSLESRKYKPARACDRPVPSIITVGINHCPTGATDAGKRH